MTPLDRLLQNFPGIKEALLHLDDYLPFIFGIPFVLFIIFIIFWTFVHSSRKAERILRGLKGKGYQTVRPDDHQLRNSLDRLAPIMFHAYDLSTVKETSPWRVRLAYGRHEGWTSRYFAHINRSVSQSTRASTILEHQFTIAFFESRTLPFSQDVYISGDRYTLDPGYGLGKVDGNTVGSLSSLFNFYTQDGKLDPMPPAFQEALRDSAPFLSIGAGRKSPKDPFLFYARLRFTPQGWGLISNEFVYKQEKMEALLRVVDIISRSLG